MADFNWCHGPQCHEKHTVDRVRGVKGSKVLRTRKIKLNQYIEGTQWGFFCSNHCQNDFWIWFGTPGGQSILVPPGKKGYAQFFRACFLMQSAGPTTKSLRPVM